MTKKNQQPATNENAENLDLTEADKNRLLKIDNDGYWIKFFKETAVKLAFKAKGLTEEKALLFYGRFFRSFTEKLADLEETNEEELGAQLAIKLIQVSGEEMEQSRIKKAVGGLKTHLKRLKEEATQSQEKAKQNAPKINSIENRIKQLEEQTLQQP